MLNVIFHLSYQTGPCQALTASVTVIRVNVSATTAGAVASYECVAGYTLEGFSTRICQNNGRWSGSEPTCISKYWSCSYSCLNYNLCNLVCRKVSESQQHF